MLIIDFVWRMCRKVIYREVHSWVWDVVWGGVGWWVGSRLCFFLLYFIYCCWYGQLWFRCFLNYSWWFGCGIRRLVILLNGFFFVHLLRMYCLVFIYGQVVRHILRGPTSQICGQLLGSVLLCWSIYILAFRYGMLSLQCIVLGSAFRVRHNIFNIACRFVLLYFEGDI